ncbi:MAG: GNAT family N-acetyltransferase [Enterocloster sp.]
MDLVIEKAVPGDSRAISELIKTVWEQMDRKEWYVIDDEKYIYDLLSSGKAIGYKAVDWDNGKLAGIFYVIFPGKSEGNLGRDIGLPEEELELVAHMDSAAILPEYRGNDLQYRMMQEAERELTERGFRYLMCTVHPENHYSRGNVLQQGYQVMATKEKYGGYLRDILMKRI